jgi:hypothetical protein
MNDPLVVSLLYRLDVSYDVVRYVNPPSVTWSTPVFDADLTDGILTCTMNQHLASIEDARNAVDIYLRAWELEAALRRGRHELHFVYDNKAEVVDRNPSPSPAAGNIVNLSAHGVVTVTGTASLTVIANRVAYPAPPTRFQISPNVETMWNRYQGYLAGREPLQSMAYFCLTVMEYDAGGGRAGLCAKYQIDKAVRDTLGDLTTDRGDPSTARKMTSAHTGTPLTGNERNWIEAAVKALILRIGEYDPQNPMPMLTMQDLPAL